MTKASRQFGRIRERITHNSRSAGRNNGRGEVRSSVASYLVRTVADTGNSQRAVRELYRGAGLAILTGTAEDEDELGPAGEEAQDRAGQDQLELVFLKARAQQVLELVRRHVLHTLA